MAIVLIVDDQTINLKILERYAAGVTVAPVVRGFTSPLDALASIEVEVPDLIVTDFVMPIMSGEEFIRRCRLLPGTEEVPIIVVTAYEDRDFRYRALDAGASDFLLSPVDGQEFRTRARNLLTLRAHQLALTSRATVLEGELAESARRHAEAIRRRERQLRRVVDTVPALIRATDAAGHVLLINSYHRNFFDVHDGVGSTIVEPPAFGDAYGDRHLELDRYVLDMEEPIFEMEERLVDRAGADRVLLTTKAPLLDGAGDAAQVVTVSFDITERKRAEQAIKESEERFRNLVEGSLLGIVIERDGAPIFANHACARIFGFDSPAELLSLPSLERVFAEGERLRWQRLRSTGEGGAPEPHEFRCLRTDGTAVWVAMQTQEVNWKGAPALQSTIADVTLRRAYEERLQRQANFDEVTGLPNRSLALDRLRRAVVSAVRHRHRGAVLFIDLDQFKKINDTWGHATGDIMLMLAADRIRQCVREEDTVARLGGDEFIVILPYIGSPSHSEPVIEKILRAFSSPFALELHQAFVTASIGVSIFPDDTDDPAVLMRNADAAMYCAKESGRNTFQYFTPELDAKASERMRIEAHLVHALARDEFSLHFQPIVDLRSGEIAGAEALLRWTNPELGVFPPERFVPLAEDTGLIVPVGRWILETACRHLGEWRRSGLAHIGLSVNISARQLRGKGLVEAVAQALLNHGLPAHCLELEITESCLMSNTKETTAALQALDRLGVRLALDDFGTGYSSLNYIKQLPVDTVKIDKSFVTNSGVDPGDATVVETIISMAHSLGIRVIGEGVETAEHVEFIRSRGCDLAQGYYFGHPLSAEAFRAWCDAYPRAEKGNG